MAKDNIEPLSTDLEKLPVESGGQYVFVGKIIEKINQIIKRVNKED